MEIAELKNIVENFPFSELPNKTNTIAHIFKKDNRENFISDWLAFLFDPFQYGGYEPLNAFLALLHLDTPIYFSENETILIEREHTFEDGRRIDFLITTDEYVIGIENKIDHSEGNNQLKDYYKSLKALADTKNKKPIPIFLKPQKNPAQVNSKFYEILYEDLIDSFKTIRLDFIGNLRSAFLMEDFIKHMEDYVMENEYEINNTLKFIVENNKPLRNIKNQTEKEVSNFASFLEKKVAELKDNDDEWDTKAPSSGSFIQLFKTTWVKYGIHYELLPETKNSVFPDSYEIVLHCESTKDIKNKFNGIKSSADEKYKKTYNIDFSSEQKFSDSILQMIEHLKNLKIEYTDKIDEFISKHPIS